MIKNIVTAVAFVVFIAVVILLVGFISSTKVIV